MKVVLPSNGYLGTSYVDMREPNIGDLRSTISATNEDYLFKLEFVSRLAEFDKEKVSMNDVQYLFDIAAAAVSFNKLKYTVECSECGDRITDEFVMGRDDIEITTLSRLHKRTKKKIGGEEYVFRILSALDGEKIHAYALDDDENQKMIENATVCRVLGREITDENIEWVQQIPVSVYISAFLFIKANWHGMTMHKTSKCPKCGKKSQVQVTLDSTWVKVDVPTIVAQYAQIRDALDFKSFLEFTMPEYRNFVDYLNAEADD